MRFEVWWSMSEIFEAENEAEAQKKAREIMLYYRCSCADDWNVEALDREDEEGEEE